MDYGLASFDGNHCRHVYARTEHTRLDQLRKEAAIIARRKGFGS